MSRAGISLAILLAAAFLAFPHPVQAQPVKIAFVGDSMADGLWGAFFRAAGRQQCDGEVINLIRDARNGSGLARPDHYDWETDLDQLVNGERPDLVVASIGLNDRQAIVTRDKHQIRLGSPEWLAAYRQNVESFYRHATSGGARLLVIGMPVLRDSKANAQAQQINGIFQDVAASEPTLNTDYVPPWQLASAAGYASFGPDLAGTTVQIRAPDGVHFTQSGYDVVAAYLRTPLVTALAEQHVTVAPTCFGG